MAWWLYLTAVSPLLELDSLRYLNTNVREYWAGDIENALQPHPTPPGAVPYQPGPV
jgi:hypothetical protein